MFMSDIVLCLCVGGGRLSEEILFLNIFLSERNYHIISFHGSKKLTSR